MNRAPAADAIVVGAGVVGAACAAELAEAGLRVRVLEAAFPGAGATSAAMGHLVVMDDSPAQLALTRLGVALWHEMRPELDQSCEWDGAGTLWLAEDAAQLQSAQQKVDLYQSAGLTADLVSEGELARLEPSLCRGLAGAVRVGEDAIVYPPAAVAHLLDRARIAGAEVIRGAHVQRIIPHGVQLDGRTVSAEFVVNAAGVGSTLLTKGLPVRPRRGHLAITDRYPHECTHELVELGYLTSAHGDADASVAFNVQPRTTGQLLIGSSREFVGLDRTVNPQVLGQMLARAVRFLPALRRMQVIRTWTGLRPSTADHLPLIGPWPEVPGLWIATGHEGLGIATAPATGRLLTDLVLGRPPSIDARPYHPDREIHA